MKYKAVFFDWDGTAVQSRTASTDRVIQFMKPLLQQGVYMIIISGTTYENIASGKIHELFPEECLNYLYLGLGRGAYNYGFVNGKPVVLQELKPGIEERIKLHRTCYCLHEQLLKNHDLCTDIVFTRPNYCKVDLMSAHVRGEALFLQQEEIDQVRTLLKRHHVKGGLKGLLELSGELGRIQGIPVQATTDAKYIEIGLTTKSHNVDYFINDLLESRKIYAQDCCFWGDEFGYLDEGVLGSDAYMITECTEQGDFFDVSKVQRELPENVKWLGGGISSFHDFLKGQEKE